MLCSELVFSQQPTVLQVDLMRRHCFPVYWNGENRRVLRGHWFARKGGVDWIPLREDVSEQLELAYNCQVQTFCGVFFSDIWPRPSASIFWIASQFTITVKDFWTVICFRNDNQASLTRSKYFKINPTG
jgi:hypothetical protein